MIGGARSSEVSAELVDVLLQNELQSIESEVNQGREEHILKTLDERGIAQELIGQQYSGRYPFELLQNANDAAARLQPSESRQVGVRFVVTDTALLVANMGTGFGPDEVRAICGLGRSSKDPRKSIGYKGIGFKSVAEITDTPQVISMPFHFGFDASRVRAEVSRRVTALRPQQRLPIYAFPFPLSEADLGSDDEIVEDCKREGYVTILRLPFKPGVTRSKVEEDLTATLSPRLLLFLEATDRLEVLGIGKSFRVARRVTHLGGMNEITLLSDDNSQPERWLVFSKRLSIPSQELVRSLGDKWLQVVEVGVSVAFPDRHAEVAVPAEAFPLHVYFPTKERTGLPFIISGDFYLEMDRRYVSRTPEAEPYNEWLTAELADFVASDVAPALASHYQASAKTVIALAPVRDADNFGQVIRGLYRQVMRRARFIPAIDGRPRLAAEALLLPGSTPRPSDAHEFLSLAGVRRLVIPSVEANPAARRFLREDLEVSEMDVRDAVAHLGSPRDAANRSRMYAWLAAWGVNHGLHRFARIIAEVPCVYTTSGAWMRPGAGVYFPRERDAPDLSPRLPISIADIPDDAETRALLSEAGVRPFRWRELLTDSVLPLLEDPDTEEEMRHRALEAVRVYFDTQEGADKEISARVGRVLLHAKTSSGDKGSLRPASQVYFSQSWLDNDRLNTIYGPFGKPEFLADFPPDDFQKKKALFDFFIWLGVSSLPRVDDAVARDATRYRLTALGQHPHVRYQAFWREWLDASGVAGSIACKEGHAGYQLLAASFGLDRLPEIIASRDRDRLRASFLELADGWATTYRNAATAIVRCTHGWHSGNRDRRLPSLLFHILSTAEWIPASRGGLAVLAAPEQIWRAGHDMPRPVTALVAVLERELDIPMSISFSQELGVVDSARATADQLMGLLTELSTQFADAEGNVDKSSRVVAAARWAMRRLNEALEGVGKDDREDLAVPLLARLAGTHVFTTKPYFSDDVFLSDTWQEEVPVLDGDRGLQRLKSFFELADLADAVVIRPIATGVLNQQSDEVRAHLAAAAPYLAALAVDASASRAEIIHARLPRLDLIACRDLVLTYQLADIQKTRGNLKTYIARRLEPVGTTGPVKRMIGTAYVQVSDALVDWYSLGPQLADFLEVPTQGDAFAIILSSGDSERKRYLSSRGLSMEAVDAQQQALRSAGELDLPDAFIELFEGTVGTGMEADAAEVSRRDLDEEQASDAATTSGQGDGKDAEQDRIPELPALDFDAITAVDASGQLAASAMGGVGRRVPRTTDISDWQRLEHDSRRYGRRGEEAVFGSEQRRLVELGYDPDAVVWQSQKDEFSDYDIASLDDDGQRVYIEVKSTTGDDESAPFQISAGELRSALRHRSRYFIYRVIDVTSASPKIVRYRDPIGRFQAAEATLNLGNAWMRLPPAE